MVLDPHSATGTAAASMLAALDPSDHPVISLATAHPAKFPDAVARAIGVRPELPPHLADLFERPERTQTVANDLATVEALVETLTAP
jgi:threonine synthase